MHRQELRSEAGIAPRRFRCAVSAGTRHLIEPLEPRRLLSAGSIDTSFGLKSVSSIGVRDSRDDLGSALAVLPSGKLFVGGYSLPAGEDSSYSVGRPAFARFTHHGLPDAGSS